MTARNLRHPRRYTCLPALSALLLSLTCSTATGALRVGDICRVKGQERNTLTGMGLVVGLKGTGDGTLAPTTRSLIQVMKNMGVPSATGETATGPSTNDLKDAKNVALVVVTAEVPAHGGRQGDELDCTVSAISAKSLEGGILLLTPMLGPRRAGEKPEEAAVYAFAQGPLHLENAANSTKAKISAGCRLEESPLLKNPFFKDNKITLVLHKNHAGFAAAEETAYAINNATDFRSGSGRGGNVAPRETSIAKAIDPLTVEVQIPEDFREDPVLFTSIVLEQRLALLPDDPVVVVNESTGVIAISADLQIAPTAVTHKNMVIDVGTGMGASQFTELDTNENTSAPQLKALVQALNALRVSSTDMIQIIRELDERGAIYGRVVYRR